MVWLFRTEALGGANSPKKELIGTVSHGTPKTSANEIERRAAKARNKSKNGRFIQAISDARKKEIRRASEQTSPQVACAVGHPAMGRGRRIEQWQLARSAVFVSDTRTIRPENGEI